MSSCERIFLVGSGEFGLGGCETRRPRRGVGPEALPARVLIATSCRRKRSISCSTSARRAACVSRPASSAAISARVAEACDSISRRALRGGFLLRVELAGLATSSFAKRGLTLGVAAVQLGELRFAGGDLPGERPPIDQADLRPQVLQPRGALAVAAGLAGLRSARCAAGFPLRRRCRRGGAGSARRARAAARRSPSWP